MSYNVEDLYKLLPAYLRERDDLLGESNLSVDDKTGPLKAVMSLFSEQIQMINENLEQLYDDQFIETCSGWVVPYMGELVGTSGLLNIPDAPFSQRAQVANTIAYRRRKGTAAVLEQLARDVSGWPAKVVEYFQFLCTSQHMNHLRSHSLASADIRDADKLVNLDTPFDSISRTADVRSIHKRRAKHNIANIGLFVYKNAASPVSRTSPYKIDDRRYCFDPLGFDIPLYHKNEAEDKISNLATLQNVPHQIKRRYLHNNPSQYYGKQKSILIEADGKEIVASRTKALKDLIVATRLSDKTDSMGNIIGWENLPRTKIAIDPELGRIAFPSTQDPPSSVKGWYHYGSLAEYGGGEYDRASTFQVLEGRTIHVPGDAPGIQAAFSLLGSRGGIIEIQNSEVYKEDLSLNISRNRKVELRAANKTRPIIVLQNEASFVGANNSELSINGLTIVGNSIKIPRRNSQNRRNQLGLLSIQHCSIRSEFGLAAAVPITEAIINENSETDLRINKSFTGSIKTIDTSTLTCKNCIIDSGASYNVAISGSNPAQASSPLNLENTTIIGKVRALKIVEASNCIFMARILPVDTWSSPLFAERLQEGCVRYSYLPEDARVPRPYNCLIPDSDENGKLFPVFKSLQFRDPYYGQLSQRSSSLISEGSEENSEMGIFHDIFLKQRISNLKSKLDEYLPFGLEAGIFLV